MAAIPKISVEQWQYIRAHWQQDPRLGFVWLVQELQLDVSEAAVRKRAKSEGWGKVRESTRELSGASFNSEGTSHEPLAAPSKSRKGRNPRKGLTAKERVFVDEYLASLSPTTAAKKAGYKGNNAPQVGALMRRKPRVADAIAQKSVKRAKALGLKADDILKVLTEVATLDVNEFFEHRRVCCPHCWGKDFGKQYTPAGLEAAKAQHQKERYRRLKANEDDDIGEFPEYKDAWYDKRRPINMDCPECFGDGVGEVIYKDTRTLSDAARQAYMGVKTSRDGTEIVVMNKEKAIENLGKAFGVWKEQETQLNVNVISADSLVVNYAQKIDAAYQEDAAILAERGLDAQVLDIDALEVETLVLDNASGEADNGSDSLK